MRSSDQINTVDDVLEKVYLFVGIQIRQLLLEETVYFTGPVTLFSQFWASIVGMLVCFFVSIKKMESSYLASVFIMCRGYALYILVIVEICSIPNCADSVHHKAGQLRRPLVEGVSNTKQADGSIHENQLLNFLVNSLDEEIALILGENAEIGVKDIYRVLVGTYADGTSASTLCKGGEDAPHGNSVLYHLRIKFDLETFEQIGNMLPQKDVLDVLPEQAEVCVDLHLRSYYGDEDDTDGLYRPQAKRGTTTFYAYATLYARVKSKRYTLAARRLEGGDTASSILAESLGILSGLDLGVKAAYLDREFYDSKCLTLLRAYNRAHVMPIARWGRMIKREFPEGWSRVIQHSLTVKLDGRSRIVGFPVYIDCTYQNGWYDEHGVARHGYVAGVPFINSPRDARYHYTKRLGIEANYRLSE